MLIPSIIVHGGAGWIQDHVWPGYQRGTQAAAQAGQAVLDSGGSALDAVTAAIVALEDDETFNAGYGSSLNADGIVENDALIMRSEDLRSGACACVSGVRNPILLARAVLERTPHELLAGTGARRFAESSGLALCVDSELASPRRRGQWEELKASGASYEQSIFLESKAEPAQHSAGDGDAQGLERGTPERTPQQGDTVGACAIDRQGGIAVGSSTGGIMLKLPGRVGDVPVLGAGAYCGPAGAVTCTGHGEAAMRVVLAKFVYDLLNAGASADEAAQAGIAELVSKVDGKAGVIVLDARGQRAWCTSTTRIAAGIPEGLLDAQCGSI